MTPETLIVRVAHDDELASEVKRVRAHYRRYAEDRIYRRLRADLERSAESGGWFIIENARGEMCAVGLIFLHPESKAIPSIELGGDLVTARYRGFALQRALVAIRLFTASVIFAPKHPKCFAVVGADNAISADALEANGFASARATQAWLDNAAYRGVALTDFPDRYRVLHAGCGERERWRIVQGFQREMAAIRTRRGDGRSVRLDCRPLGAIYTQALSMPLPPPKPRQAQRPAE